MSKFEKKFGKYAIRDLSLMLILCYGVGYVISMITPEFLGFLTLNPYKILHGQVWRLFTWIVIPPSGLNLFTIIMLYFYYSVGTSLEYKWGVYRYNVYLFSGMLFTILGSFLSMAVYYFYYGDILSQYGSAAAEMVFMQGSYFFSTYYINMSILLAFAATFPDSEVLLMFVIPVKMKWLGIVYAAILIMDFVNGTGDAMSDIFFRTALLSSLLNFIVFFIMSRRRLKRNIIPFRKKM